MSCFNCYSSRKVDPDIIDKVLQRGQKLRSAMVQSILNNDPFTKNVIVAEDRKVKFDEIPKETNAKIRAFLQGDAMSREDEVSTLETLRSMSALDLCKVTDSTYRSDEPCDCLKCFKYNEKDLNISNNEVTQKIQEKCKSQLDNYLQFVDSLKVSVNSVVLSEAGDKKVVDSFVKDKNVGVGQTFFLEYQISDNLLKASSKNRSKVDTGLDFGNTVRLCSRRANLQAISFKQTSVHDVTINLQKLSEASIKFRLSVRHFKQKQPVFMGVAKFSFSSFQVAKNFICNQELTIRLNDNAPIVIGSLKISVQLGCGRLYFGKEFLDAITNDKENAVTLNSDDLSSPDSDTDKILDYYLPREQKHIDQKPKVPKLKLLSSKPDSDNHKVERKSSRPQISKPINKKTDTNTSVVYESQKNISNPILFGFVFIPEARFSREVMNSFLTCHMFATDDACNSKLVAFSSKPQYNFSQEIPLVCDEDFLLRLRENFMVVEFFEKDEKNFLVGLTKISLHQYYLAYRNLVVVKYLSERKFPVIGFDGWESILDPYNGDCVGQAQFLVALGTKEQIETLQREKGLKGNCKIKSPICKRVDVGIQNSITIKTPIPKSVDVGIQSNMEPKDIESLLNKIVAQKDSVENSTNTEPEMRSTSDLLDTLQKALSVDTSQEKNWFKAHVAINSALHLPGRRKCRSRRSKSKNNKSEDILPSCYVTFEDYKGDLKITPIIAKSTAPKWEFQCDAALPVEYLTDNQKFLVFKVWRKSNNATMTPNMQVDHVIGFATVDLTVLTAGLPSVQGWFNINDLSKKCNGQINIHITPLENVTKYKEKCVESSTSSQLPEVQLEPEELLGRALKRKFTELDEITQRLRLRLSKVTDESDASNDETADEFERDINTLCVEDDFDMVNFETEARNFNLNHNKEALLLSEDQHLQENKQKIDQLLEKLSLVSGEMSSRYVSGCSDGRIDTEAILSQLDFSSRPNLHSSRSFSREMVQKFGKEASDRSEGEGSTETTTD